MNNCIIAQSGGPTSVINASLYGVIEAVLNSKKIDRIYGSINGIQGVLNNHIMDLSKYFLESPLDLELLKTTPAMFLGSCRYKLPSVSDAPEIYDKIFRFLEAHNIFCFFYIGGNDSMDTVYKLSQYAITKNSEIQFIGIPKTIDNDLFGTDHTPGFGSAAKYVASTMLEVALDAYIYDTNSILIVEIMGRNAGWLTAATALARTPYSSAPDLIYLPEVPFDEERFIQKLIELQKNEKHIVIAVSEGIKDQDGSYIAASHVTGHDTFGHSQLSGVAKTLEALITRTLACKVRSIELNVLQRSAAHCASLTDMDEAIHIGKTAVEMAEQNETGIMMTVERVSDEPYAINIQSVKIEKVANKEKCVPIRWISQTHHDVTDDFLTYVAPLIVGETQLSYRNGIPNYLSYNS